MSAKERGTDHSSSEEGRKNFTFFSCGTFARAGKGIDIVGN
jgi:hypothetical protein